VSKNNYANIAVYDLTFYRADDDGNELKDENGKVITYRAETDCTYLAEGLDIEDLEEVSEEKYYTQDLGSLVISEKDKKEIEKDWSAWILKQAERGLIEADGLFDEKGERT
tara:strand:- start:1719 stop:2051 length:333 start_codon:yes stop_codon:yes gene_type:complete